MNTSLPWACHLTVVVELEHFNDPKSYASWDLNLWFNLARLVKEEEPDKGQPQDLQVWVGHGANHPVQIKTNHRNLNLLYKLNSSLRYF